MVTVNESETVVRLQTSGMSYLLDLKRLQSLHWGRKVELDDWTQPPGRRHHSSFDADIDAERSEYFGWDGRSFVEPNLRINRDGERFTFLRYRSYEIVEIADGVRSLHITLDDRENAITLRLEYDVYEEYDIIARRAVILNEGDALRVESFQSASVCPPELACSVLRYLTGYWSGEFQISEIPIGTGSFALQSKRGISGPHFNPSFALSDGTATEHQGDVWFGLVAYSGNWKITVEKTAFNNVRVTGGTNDFDFGYRLEPGGTLSTPDFYLGFTDQGYGGMSRRLHRFESERIMASTTSGRVLYNSWEATTFAVNVLEQKRLADSAADLGVELFVVDDGWFGARDSDSAGLGDWTPSAKKFPNGLEELIDHVKGRGMDFGLWVEPEAVNPDSDLYRAHPQWIYRTSNVEPLTLRNQYVLNLSIPDVEHYITETLSRLLRTYDITYLKWDMNRSITDMPSGVESGSELWRKHIDALYRICAGLKSSFPRVELEICAGGGGRVDAGILRYADTFWPSDNTDPYERLLIQEGFTQFYPPGTMTCWVTSTPERSGRTARAKVGYKFHSAMCGRLGIGSDLERLTEEQRAAYQQHVAEYKSIRKTILTGDLYRLASHRTSNHCAVEYISADGAQVVILFFLQSQRYGEPAPRVALHGLQSDACYRIDGSDTTYHGSYLMHTGLRPQLTGDFESAIVKLERLAD